MLPRSNGRFLCLRHTGSRTGATLLEKTRSLDAQARHSAWKRRQIAYASGSENARNQQAPELGNESKPQVVNRTSPAKERFPAFTCGAKDDQR